MNKTQNLVSGLIDTEALNQIEGNLITLPELRRILKKKSASSIAHLIMNKKIKVTKLLGRYYVTKEDLNIYLFPSVDESTKQTNHDYELDKGYQKFLGIKSEDKGSIPKHKKVVLTDDKEADAVKANSKPARIKLNK